VRRLAFCFALLGLAAASCADPLPPRTADPNGTAAPASSTPDTAGTAPTGPYVVLPPVAIATPLFAADRAALQAKAIGLIAAQGAQVVKVEELAAFTTPEPTCRAPRTFEDRVRARFGRAPQVRVVASCEAKPCTITLILERPGPTNAPAEPIDRFEANVDAPDTPAGWLAAMDKLGPPTSVAVLGLAQRRAGPPTARAESVATFGKWDGPVLPTAFDFGPCFEEGWVRGRADAVHVAVGDSGAATSCEVDPDPIHPTPARLQCLCRVATAKPFGAGDPNRRLDIRVTNDLHGTVDVRGAHYAARFQAVHASDDADVLPHLERASARIAACVAAAAAPVPPISHLRLDVDATGNVTRVAMDGANDAFRACCGATLRTAPLPCGRSGAYHVDAELAVGTVP
jgi:hypothetical protein